VYLRDENDGALVEKGGNIITGAVIILHGTAEEDDDEEQMTVDTVESFGHCRERYLYYSTEPPVLACSCVLLCQKAHSSFIITTSFTI
jgi:hypothetical protein